MIKKEIILAYALANALKHGKAIVSAVLPKLFQFGLKKEEIKEIMPIVKKIVAEVNAMSNEEKEKKFAELKNLIKTREERKGLPELEVKGKLVMRLAPFPSGPLHIGNVRPFLLNDEYVKKYKGKLLLVIDDTIGSEEKQIVKEAYDLIPEGLEWLGICFEKPIIYKSDRLEIYYEYAEKLIKLGKAYVCFCKAEEMHRYRAEGKECEHRNASIEENLENWRKMLQGEFKPGEATLRLKTDMQHKNPAFRDRVLFRIVDREHPRVGKKYKVWPMLEMSWAIDDHLLGITHVLRGKELMIETEMEKYIFSIFDWPIPEFIHTGILQFEGIKLSKSKAQKEVASGKYFGWDDPRTWSIQSLRRRGFQPEAIRNFILQFGLTQTEIKIPLEVL